MTLLGDYTGQRVFASPEAGSFRVSWCALTHVGYHREINEDSCVVNPPLFAVADGMGGHAAGEIASAAVVRQLAELGTEATIEDVTGALFQAVDDIGKSVHQQEGMSGTTVTGALMNLQSAEPHWVIFNIGDSRVYEFSEDHLTQVTVDHSVVQQLVDSGTITVQEAEYHPHANAITRAVGMLEDPIPDLVRIPLQDRQRLLICSDGLTKELTFEGLQYFLASADTAQTAAETLLAQALGNVGRDNITVIVLEVSKMNP